MLFRPAVEAPTQTDNLCAQESKPRREAGLDFPITSKFQIRLRGRRFDTELPKDRLQASAFSRLNSP